METAFQHARGKGASDPLLYNCPQVSCGNWIWGSDSESTHVRIHPQFEEERKNCFHLLHPTDQATGTSTYWKTSSFCINMGITCLWINRGKFQRYQKSHPVTCSLDLFKLHILSNSEKSTKSNPGIEDKITGINRDMGGKNPATRKWV